MVTRTANTCGNQAEKGRVFYSFNKYVETGADARNICDKQILKIWTSCLSAFYWVKNRTMMRDTIITVKS